MSNIWNILYFSDNHLDFLSFRFWIGAWVSLILVVIIAFDLSALVQYITRFTEESFAVLISLIFIFESFTKLVHIWDTHPIHIHALHENATYKCHCIHPPPTAMNSTAANSTAANSNINITTPLPDLVGISAGPAYSMGKIILIIW